jgi:large subunit ribosomal protein L21
LIAPRGILEQVALTLLSTARYTFGLSLEAIFWRKLTVAYAIIQAGGKQFRVTKGEIVQVPSLVAEVGSSVEFDALLSADGDQVDVGTSALEGQRVSATVVKHGRGRKVIVFKKKRRKQYKKIHGHRQNFTAVRIDSVGATSGESE